MAGQSVSDSSSSSRSYYQVDPKELPLRCPMPGSELWSSHPRVFLSLEKTGHAKCPYCGAEYVLKGTD